MRVITPEDARYVTRQHWEINAFATILESEWGGTFNLATGEQPDLILKITPSHVDRLRIELEVAAIQYLSKSGIDLLFPKIIPSIQGDSIVETDFGKARIYSWIDGRLWSQVNPHSFGLLSDLGRKLGLLKRALQGFDHPGAHHNFLWSPHQIGLARQSLPLVEEQLRDLIGDILERISSLNSIVDLLPKAVNYNDANDQNIIVSRSNLNPEVVGFIDFGDLHYGPRVNDLAICLAYAMMRHDDPITAACAVISGYCKAHPLEADEAGHLFDLIKARLSISIIMAAERASEDPNNAYWQISARDAKELFLRLTRIPAHLALSRFRHAAGYEPCPKSEAIVHWLKHNKNQFHFILGELMEESRKTVLDWSVGSTGMGTFEDIQDVESATFKLFHKLKKENTSIGIGRYNEPRVVYTTDEFKVAGFHTSEARTLHLGIDLFAPAGTPLYAPLGGKVFAIVNNDRPKEYGPMLILEHNPAEGIAFYTLYGHNSIDSLSLFSIGDTVEKGQLIGYIGDTHENGNWIPHVHFQVLTDTLEYTDDFPGVAPVSQSETWLSLCPDPNLILKMDEPGLKVVQESNESILRKRNSILGPNLSLSFNSPLNIVRGHMTELFDQNGHAYLDTGNNVYHCGHEHPRIVSAGQKQMAILNTNTRFLSELRLKFAEQLLSTLPDHLTKVYFVNSGSEANDLALRIARLYTGSNKTWVMDQGYHGHTGLSLEVSHYKFSGKGGPGNAPHIGVLPSPTIGALASYRSMNNGSTTAATFIHETLPSCAGQIFPGEDYFQTLYAHIKGNGGVCIADEVQTGLGRVGDHFWSFELYELEPDIVTIGKPLGNGHPIAAVVMTEEMSATFNNGMEFFSSFGGNPVSCAIANEVLNVIRDDDLMAHARKMGATWKGHLEHLQELHSCILDVRGTGLYLGVEFDSALTCEGISIAKYIENRMLDHRILTSFDGPLHNVMKLKPPMSITLDEIERFTATLYKILLEDPVARATSP